MEQTIGVIDLDTWSFAYLSPRFEAVWGRPRHALMSDSRRFLDWVHPDDRERMIAQLARPVDEPTEVEFRIVRGDGVVRWLRSYAVTIEEPDAPRRLLGVTEDVTERRRLVDGLRTRIAELEARVATLETGRTPPPRYTVTCRHCAETIVVTSRIGDGETTALRAHIENDHRDVLAVGSRLTMDSLLAQYRVANR